MLPTRSCSCLSEGPVPFSLFSGRKFPNVEEQSDSPSIQLLEKKKEAKIMQEAMEHKKEVRWGVGGDKGRGSG